MVQRLLGIILALAATATVAASPLPGWHWWLPPGMAPPPVPADNPMSPAKVELGRRLFYDADLSVDGTMACATCHEQKHAFADGNATHPGVSGQAGRRNVPGLGNIAWYAPLTMADPTQLTLEQQVAVPVAGTHPVEMGMAGREAEIAVRLSRDDCYKAMFARAFPGSDGRIDFLDITRAVASFERTLVSYGSAYDRGQLSPGANAGRVLFAVHCASCHAGPRFTDLAYHRLDTTGSPAADRGLAEISGQDADQGRFRTPSLRNVALTGPWWHDGTSDTLEDAVARHRQALPPKDMARLLDFLKALSDPTFVSSAALALPTTACGRRL